MRSYRFAIGVLAGLLLASGVVFASNYAFALTQSAPAFLTAEITASTTTASTTSQTVAPPYFIMSNSTATTSTCACQSTYSSNITAGFSSLSSAAQAAGLQPPSRLGTMLSQPGQVLLLLVPVIMALFLGLAFYKGSNPGD